jgi:hypothetical protein
MVSPWIDGLRRGLDKNSTERGRRRHDLRRFDDTRAIENRIGERARVKDRDRGIPREFDDLSRVLGAWL